MIRIGLTKRLKLKEVKDYLDKNKNIKEIVWIYYKEFETEYNIDLPIQYVEFDETEMYRTFYPLLEKIDDDVLIVIDECLRTKNRSELKYNCIHKYLNQTEHRIVFEYFPIIEELDDFMILMDFNTPLKYKQRSFDHSFLQLEDIKVKPRKVKMDLINLQITDKELNRYEAKAEKLFENLGKKDPNTIPRALQLLAGDYKKKNIDSNKVYIARNDRMKLDNVYTYTNYIKNRKDYIVIDTHYQRLRMNDFLKTTKIEKLPYLTTTLSIDKHIVNEFVKWTARRDSIYVKASLY